MLLFAGAKSTRRARRPVWIQRRSMS